MRLFLTPISRRIAPEEAQFLASARAVQFQTPLGELHAYEWDAAGPTVLIVHGWISHAARMAVVIQALQARGLRVIAFDAPAHGRSAGRQADLHAFRDAIATVSAALGPVHGVLAHSFGALTTAAWLAETQPPTLRAAVLVGLPRDIAYLFESYTMTMALQPAVLARLRELFRRRYGGYPEEYSVQDLAVHLHLPVLLVHGGADELVPAAHASEVGEQLRDGQVLVVEGLRHSAPLRDPATVAQIAEFLAERLRAPAS
jgi:alpha-beta hydrolase superfamily lysophospholipase